MNRKSLFISLLICAVVVALAAAFASSHPDGLEKVAQLIGFEGRAAETNIINSPMPDYTIGIIRPPFWSTLVSGVLGTAAVFIITALAVKFISGKTRP